MSEEEMVRQKPAAAASHASGEEPKGEKKSRPFAGVSPSTTIRLL